MSNLFWLTDEQMARLQPYFPKSHDRQRVDDRRVLSGIIYPSRLNGHTNLAIFERAVPKLAAVRVVPLIGTHGLATVINDVHVSPIDGA